MNKILLGLLTLTISSSFAMTTVDLSKSSYSCNQIALGSAPTESQLQTDCKNAKLIRHEENTAGRNYRGPGGGTLMTKPNLDPADDINFDKIKFHTDDSSLMVCYYKNSKFIKCKASTAKKTNKNSSQAVSQLAKESN